MAMRRGIWIFAGKAKIDPVAGHNHSDSGFIRCGLSRFRRLLYEFHYRRVAPNGFVETAVESYGRRPACRSESDGSVGCTGSRKGHDDKKGGCEP